MRLVAPLFFLPVRRVRCVRRLRPSYLWGVESREPPEARGGREAVTVKDDREVERGDRRKFRRAGEEKEGLTGGCRKDHNSNGHSH